MKRPLAYLTAAWSGEPDIDMELAAHYCRLAYEAGFSPICPLLYEMENRLNDPELFEIRAGLLERLLAHMNDVRDPLRSYWWERRPWNDKAAKATWDYTGYTRQRSEPDYEKPQLDYDTGLVPEGLVRTKKKAPIKPGC